MPEIKPYTHEIKYYETDMMGITHHANYLHFMEEARIDFMDQMGFSYRRMEETGVVSPVVRLSCEYKKPTTFGDKVTVSVSVASFSGAVLAIRYEMRNDKDETVFIGNSEHTFLTKEGRFVRLKKEMPDFYEALTGMLN